jgi:hypothetical protein
VREEEEDGDRAGIDRVTDLRFFSAIGRPVLLMYETNYGFFLLTHVATEQQNSITNNN